MENGTGRISTLRSLVRPVSPLSRMSKSLLPGDDLTQDTPSTRRGAPSARSRSRSPILASAVHLARPRALDVNPHNLEEDGETRRIIVRRPDLTLNSDPLDSTVSGSGFDNTGGGGGGGGSGRGLRRQIHSRDMDSLRPAPVPVPTSGVDREKTCPILIRISYTTNGRHTPLSEYDKGRFPRNMLYVNTW
ncbi:unnamed protein product [Echinostoma caproni]|uniref:Kinesin motor domain-containing protein n=1 Tax=Echinostoma caproni TaxID=27848 RepID=A0A183B6J4_9TREM|nr:unnamed protein product [Echinostoma caproni]